MPRYPGVGGPARPWRRPLAGKCQADTETPWFWKTGLLLSVSRKGAMSWATCAAALSRDGREAGPRRCRGAETVRTHLGMRVPAGRASHVGDGLCVARVCKRSWRWLAFTEGVLRASVDSSSELS